MIHTVLLVDDIPEYLDTMELYLPDNCRAMRAESIKQAKKQVRAVCPELAVLDIRLREDIEDNQEGLDLLRWLKKHFPQIPVIMTSAYREFEYEIESLNFGAAYFLRKPIQQDEFRKVVAEVLANE